MPLPCDTGRRGGAWGVCYDGQLGSSSSQEVDRLKRSITWRKRHFRMSLDGYLESQVGNHPANVVRSVDLNMKHCHQPPFQNKRRRNQKERSRMASLRELCPHAVAPSRVSPYRRTLVSPIDDKHRTVS